MNETITNATINNLDVTSIKTTSIGILEYLRTIFLSVSTFLSKYVPFEADKIQIILMLILALWLAAKLADPRHKSNVWLLLAGTIFYFLYFFK